jgi:hypothetical protein
MVIPKDILPSMMENEEEIFSSLDSRKAGGRSDIIQTPKKVSFFFLIRRILFFLFLLTIGYYRCKRIS